MKGVREGSCVWVGEGVDEGIDGWVACRCGWMWVGEWIGVCGCLDEFGCVGVWVCGCGWASVSLGVGAGVRMCGCAGVRVGVDGVGVGGVGVGVGHCGCGCVGVGVGGVWVGGVGGEGEEEGERMGGS